MKPLITMPVTADEIVGAAIILLAGNKKSFERPALDLRRAPFDVAP